MPVITVRTEKNLGQLLGKLYVGLEPAELKRVQEATLKANPHLRVEGNFKPGTLVVLPEVGTTVPTVPGSNDASAAQGVEQMLADINTHVPQLMRDLEQTRAELDLSAKLLKSAPFKRAMEGAQAETETLVKGFESSLKAEREASDEAMGFFSKDVDVLKDDLQALLKKLT